METEKPVAKGGLGPFLGWGLGGLFAISGIIELLSRPLTGIFTLLAGLVIFPPVVTLLKDRLHFSLSKGLKIFVLLTLLGIGGALAGNPNTPPNNESASSTPMVTLHSPTPSATISPTISQEMTLLVLNGTEVKGLATKIKTSILTQLPDSVILTGDAHSDQYQNSLIVPLTDDGKADASSLAAYLKISVAESLPLGEVKPKGTDIVLIVGTDLTK